MSLTKSQISKDAKSTWSFNGEPNTSHFPVFPFTCKAPFRVHGKFLHADTAACHIYAPVCWQSVCAKILTPQIKRQSFKLLQVKLPKSSFVPANLNWNTPCKTDRLKPNPNKLRHLRHAYKQKQTELAVLWSATTGYHLADKVLQ